MAPGPGFQPAGTRNPKSAYDGMARDVARRFEHNFTRFEPFIGDAVKKAAIRAAA